MRRPRCAICALRHADLLDAAHIIEDRHERGLPSDVGMIPAMKW